MKTLLKYKIMVNDSGWKGAYGGRCITDYDRSIEFSEELTDEEIETVRQYLIENDSPGWTPMKVYANGKVYKFATTNDSSDQEA